MPGITQNYYLSLKKIIIIKKNEHVFEKQFLQVFPNTTQHYQARKAMSRTSTVNFQHLAFQSQQQNVNLASWKVLPSWVTNW